jgi:uncharacterized membrane protein YbhN (UPF0104 family)
MTSRTRSVAGVVLPLTVLGVVLWRTGHGPVVAGVRALDVPTLMLGVAIGVPATAACAWRWRAVAAALGTPVRAGEAVAACYAAQLLNCTLPSGVAGELYRGLRHAPPGGRGRGLRAVGWERAAGQAVQVMAATAVVLLVPSPVRAPAWLVLALAAVVGAVLVLARRWEAGWAVLRDDVRRLRSAGVLPVVVVSSLLAQAGYVATGVLAARAVGVTAPVTTLVPLLLVVLVAMAVPVSLAGWGPREGAAAWCFAAAGLGAGAGVATAVAYGVIVVVAALPGAVVLLATASRPGRAVTEEVAHG